jgi:hypothetical protein
MRTIGADATQQAGVTPWRHPLSSPLKEAGMQKQVLTVVSALIAALSLPALAGSDLLAEGLCNFTGSWTDAGNALTAGDQLQLARMAEEPAPAEPAYDYGYRPLQFDEVADLTRMHRAMMRDLAIVRINGAPYRQPGLSIEGAGNELLLPVELRLAGVETLLPDDFPAGVASAVYQLENDLSGWPQKAGFGRRAEDAWHLEPAVARDPTPAVEFYSLFSTEQKRESPATAVARDERALPEPGGLAMLIAGVLGICAVARPRILSS